MTIYEIGTGYTSIPARMGAATEIVVEGLTKAFKKKGVKVKLLDIEDSNRLKTKLKVFEVPMPKFLLNTDVKLGIVHKLKRVIYSIELAKELNKHLARSKDDVLLHSHNQYNMYFFNKLCNKKNLKNVKIAYTVHSYIWPDSWNKIKKTVKKKYFQEIDCVKKADYVLVLNKRTKSHFVKHLRVDENKIYEIINGVDTDKYFPVSQNEIADFKEKINLSGYKIVFQVGSICDRKNQLGALEMMKDFLKNHPNVAYVYAGGIIDNEYKNEIDRIAREEGISSQVKYVGELSPGEQLNLFYNVANLTIFPSKVESFGLVIIESLSAGTPVLLADKPLFDLEKGYDLFNGKDEFVAQLYRKLECEKKIIDRSEVIKKYSWDSVAERHLNIFLKEEDRNEKK